MPVPGRLPADDAVLPEGLLDVAPSVGLFEDSTPLLGAFTGELELLLTGLLADAVDVLPALADAGASLLTGVRLGGTALPEDPGLLTGLLPKLMCGAAAVGTVLPEAKGLAAAVSKPGAAVMRLVPEGKYGVPSGLGATAVVYAGVLLGAEAELKGTAAR